jgi:hypothetical protein
MWKEDKQNKETQATYLISPISTSSLLQKYFISSLFKLAFILMGWEVPPCIHTSFKTYSDFLFKFGPNETISNRKKENPAALWLLLFVA